MHRKHAKIGTAIRDIVESIGGGSGSGVSARVQNFQIGAVYPIQSVVTLD